MARPREFDEQEVVSKAMMAFWRHGYDGTSIGDLEKATGIPRVSIYNAFGDKESLFRYAFRAYTAMAAGRLDELLSVKEFSQLVILFEAMVQPKPEDSPGNLGCLMVNTVTEVTALGEATKSIIREYREMLVSRLCAFLSEVQAEGQITAAIDPQESAEYLVGSMWGMLSTIRLYKDATKARPTANAVILMMRAWATEKIS